MNPSVQEELLAAVWFVLATMLVGTGHPVLFGLALFKGIECTVCSLVLAIGLAIGWPRKLYYFMRRNYGP